MAPIRTAIVGLSSSAKTSWASKAHLPYLLSPLGRSKYQIVALQNSSVEAAKNAIAHYNLPPDTKAYGTSEDLAADKDVDLVVVATRVDVHHSNALPSVKAGKTVFVEWPLAQDVEHAKELVDAANENNAKTLVGLQGRLSPPVVKIRELIKEGRIGKVLSSELHATGGTNDREILPSTLQYFTERAIGGNDFTIGLAHIFDSFQSILGDVTNIKSRLHSQRPSVRIRDATTNEIINRVTTNVPDITFATGTLKESQTVQKDAAVSIRFRRGQPFPGEPPLIITINGEKGEIRLRGSGGTALGAAGYSKPVTIEVHDFETDTVEEVEWKWQAWQEENGIPIIGRSIAAIYEQFSNGREEGLVSFGKALERHEQLEGMLKQWDAEKSQ
jgi:predicted dehydrogenase